MDMRLFDSHMHLDDPQFDGQRPAVVARAAKTGVVGIVAVGTGLKSSRQAVALAETFEIVHAAVGIQPNYVHEAEPEDWAGIEQLARHPAVVAIGETGLDHYWEMAPLDLQRDYFRRHLQLAKTVGKLFVTHMREPGPDTKHRPDFSCAEDILHVLVDEGAGPGIMHSYTGDATMAARFVERDMYISFAGMVTYKKSDSLRKVARTIPDERLLIETDAPYLSPHPCRGQRPNEPALIQHTAACLGEIRDATPEALAHLTTQNAMRAFGLTR